jgi:hypothetical protein
MRSVCAGGRAAPPDRGRAHRLEPHRLGARAQEYVRRDLLRRTARCHRQTGGSLQLIARTSGRLVRPPGCEPRCHAWSGPTAARPRSPGRMVVMPALVLRRRPGRHRTLVASCHGLAAARGRDALAPTSGRARRHAVAEPRRRRALARPTPGRRRPRRCQRVSLRADHVYRQAGGPAGLLPGGGAVQSIATPVRSSVGAPASGARNPGCSLVRPPRARRRTWSVAVQCTQRVVLNFVQGAFAPEAPVPNAHAPSKKFWVGLVDARSCPQLFPDLLLL